MTNPQPVDRSYVCPQCGPDPRGGDKHAWYAHNLEGLEGKPYPYDSPQPVEDEEIDAFVEELLAQAPALVTYGELAEYKQRARQLFSSQQSKHQEELKRARLEEYKLGLQTGAMPGAIGKPIAEQHIAQLTEPTQSKEEK